jgi:hypothetical protein
MDETVSGADGSYCSVTELRSMWEHFCKVNVKIRTGAKTLDDALDLFKTKVMSSLNLI